ncbi:glycosyltransferase family 87 protein [Burkholderia sp. MR1-5-21]
MKSGEHWLNAERVKVYPRIVLLMLGILCVTWFSMSKHLVDPKGKPLGYDFIAFWAASRLALAGHALDAYDIRLLVESAKVAVPGTSSVLAWFYPPAFYLVVLPLALMPYLLSYCVFIGTTLAAYVFVLLRVIGRNRTALWCVAAFPGLWSNLLHGQNAFLTAALAGAALLHLERRPIVAGVFVGLLAIKPHLALLFPVALLAERAWLASAAAAATAIAVTAAGTAALGIGTLKAFFASVQQARTFVETGALPWAKMPTVFALARMAGVPVTGAYVVHAVVALGTTCVVWRVWRRSADPALRGASLMTATFLISPYVYDYDLAWLAFPIAWLALAGLRNGWQHRERETLLAAWVLPMVMAPIGNLLPIQIGPPVLIALLWFIVRRAEAGAPADIDVRRATPAS